MCDLQGQVNNECHGRDARATVDATDLFVHEGNEMKVLHKEAGVK